MSTTEKIGDNAGFKEQNLWEKMANKMPSFFGHMKRFHAEHGSSDTEAVERHTLKRNQELQAFYDLASADEQLYGETLLKIEEFNCATESPFLASGQSSYFNEQIDKRGMSGLKLRKEDVDDAKYIAECFGGEINLSDDTLDILYTTLPGTTEMNYATQTFPAMIFEDVFQCSATHEFPFPPKVGEKEEAYWLRVLSQKMSEAENFPSDKILEAKTCGARLIRNFCKGKNRIYLIPIKDIQGNKSSFGDVAGLRGGSAEASQEEILQDMPSFGQLADMEYCSDVWSMYQNPNFTSEYGIAIYGKIKSNNIEYVEVERSYDIMQQKALRAGLKVGDDLTLSRY